MQTERLTRTFLRATLVASRPADFGRAKLFAALRSMAAVLCGLRAAPRTISPQRGAATEHDRAYTSSVLRELSLNFTDWVRVGTGGVPRVCSLIPAPVTGSH